MRRFKTKLLSKSTSSTDKDTLLQTCVNGLHTALNIVKYTAGPATAAAPGLQAGLNGLLLIIDVVKVDCHSCPLL
jgi:hypothetical protein